MQDDNGVIRYGLGVDSDRSDVQIDPLSGVVTAARIFDREVAPRLQFHVIAFDQSAAKRSSTALVSIDVRDVDDELPHFAQDRFTILN